MFGPKTDPLDQELVDLKNKLMRVQSVVGGGKVEAKNNPMAAKGGGAVTFDDFTDLQNKMLEGLEVIKEALEEKQNAEKSIKRSDAIAANQKVRSLVKEAQEDLRKFEEMYWKEERKKKSKIPPEELKARGEMVARMKTLIEQCQEQSQSKGAAKSRNVASMEDSELFKRREGAAAGGEDNSKQPKAHNLMSDGHREQLQILKQRDAQIDQQISLIGDGVDELKIIAERMNEAVKLQNKMLDTLETKIEDVHDHVVDVNTQLKETLQKARKGDKICVVSTI